MQPDKIHRMRVASYVIFVVSALGMLGSLYFSEILHFAPCMLCWYQRIALYPIAIFSFIALIRKEMHIYAYVLPLAIIGWLFAFYHNLFYWGVIKENFIKCVGGVPCDAKYLEIFGFITIPFLSLISFTVIIAACLYLWRKSKIIMETVS